MRVFAVILFAGLLSGCLTMKNGETVLMDGIDTMPVYYCTTDNTAAKKADWTKAAVIEDSINNGRYKNGLISLWQNKPYIIRITNTSDSVHSFRTPSFLRDVAILKAVYKDKAVDEPCMNAFDMAPGSSAELHIVPLKKGNYSYYNTVIWVPIFGKIVSAADVGMIIVR